MNWKVIKTEKDYQKALKRLEIIFDLPDPIEAIKFRMEQLG